MRYNRPASLAAKVGRLGPASNIVRGVVSCKKTLRIGAKRKQVNSMQEVRRVGIEGFRRLLDISIDMRPMMVMVGANGSGKTSFMDALSLLASSAEGRLNRHLGDIGGASEAITRGRQDDMTFSADMEVPGHEPLNYSLSIAVQGVAYSVSQESLTQARFGLNQQPFKHIESRYREIVYFDTEARRLHRPNGSSITWNPPFPRCRNCSEKQKN